MYNDRVKEIFSVLKIFCFKKSEKNIKKFKGNKEIEKTKNGKKTLKKMVKETHKNITITKENKGRFPGKKENYNLERRINHDRQQKSARIY